MAEAAPSLGDFFAKKAKKKIKATNLNVAANGKPEEEKKATKAKSSEDDGWQEEELVASTMKVEAAGKLIREEDKKEEEETSAPAWGTVKVKDSQALNEKRFPTLAKSVQSSAINLEDNAGKVNISTSKNMFANLEDEDEDDDDGPKRPKEIKPAMVTKKKGEKEKDAIQREVGKFTTKKEDKKAASDDEEEAAAEDKVKAKKKEEKKVKTTTTARDEEKKELDEDLKIVLDLAASKAKYKGRKKLEKLQLPKEELEEEKENKSQKANKKKWANMEDDDDGKERKLQYLDE